MHGFEEAMADLGEALRRVAATATGARVNDHEGSAKADAFQVELHPHGVARLLRNRHGKPPDVGGESETFDQVQVPIDLVGRVRHRRHGVAQNGSAELLGLTGPGEESRPGSRRRPAARGSARSW